MNERMQERRDLAPLVSLPGQIAFREPVTLPRKRIRGSRDAPRQQPDLWSNRQSIFAPDTHSSASLESSFRSMSSRMRLSPGRRPPPGLSPLCFWRYCARRLPVFRRLRESLRISVSGLRCSKRPTPVSPASHLFRPAAYMRSRPVRLHAFRGKRASTAHMPRAGLHFSRTARSIVARAPQIARRCRDILLQHDVGIGSAETKRTHARSARPGRPVLAYRGFPGRELVRDIERSPLEIDVGVDLFQVDVRRNLLVLDGEQRLEHARNAGAGLQVADIGLDRSSNRSAEAVRGSLVAPLVQFGKGLAQRLDFDRVPQARSGAVAFDIPDGRGVDLRLFIRLDQEFRLRE